MIKKFTDFPEYLQIFIKKRHKDVVDFEELIRRKIPYFKDKTLIEMMNEPDGEDKVIDMFNEMTGHIGGPYLLRKPSNDNRTREA